MEMPMIAKCEVKECAYHQNQKCHALAITIGDGTHPSCDTYCPSTVKGGDMDCTGRVGACKVTSCSFNTLFECQAREICVGYKKNNINCLTFQPG